MAEFKINPLGLQPGETIYRYTRDSFRTAGIDNYSTPPAQSPDAFLQLLNVLPSSATGVLNRRWGYRAFCPKIDGGASTDDDEFATPNTNPTIKAQHIYSYESIALNERALIGTAADGTGSNSITNNVGYWNAGGTFTNIFTPSAGATKPYGVDSRDSFYFTDGVSADLKKWTLDGGATTSKWGISAPLTAIGLTLSTTTNGAWTASTVVSTMGITVDTNNNIQFLVSLNADGSNGGTNVTTGRSGKGSPSWNQTGGGTTSDGGVTWTNKGPIGLWQANHFFSEGHFGFGTLTNPAIIYDPGTNALFFNNQGGGGTSGASQPGFNPNVGQITIDGTVRWEYLGSCNPTSPTYTGTWQPSTYYPRYGGTNDFHNTAVVEQSAVATAYNGVTNTFTQTLYLQAASTQGTTAASYSHPSWNTTQFGFTDDGQLRWVNLGPKAWAATTAYNAWAPTSQSFGAVSDTHSNIQVCITGGTSGGSTPGWPASYTSHTDYGVETNDGSTVVWAAVGPPISWIANTLFFLPLNGYVPPASTLAFGGASIEDSNSCLETVVISGETGTSTPTWAAVGSQTTDNTVTWYNVESLAGQTGTGQITLTKGRYYFAIFENSVTGALSDLSPVSAFTGPLSNGSVFLFNIPVSADPQVTNVIIVATADGGNQEFLYYVTTVTNGTTTYTDNQADTNLVLQNTYLSIDSSGTEHGVTNNTPPPNGSFPTKHRGRLYLAVNNVLYFSKSLSDLTTSTGLIAGRYEEAWPVSFQMDISEGAEKITGLYSDGEVLYIGTSRCIRKLRGDGPSGTNPYISPEIVHNEVGLCNQETWQGIYNQGTPTGIMWLTPDFRVVRSDFNTYMNAGEPIQTTLNTINTTAATTSWATFVGVGPYNFYVLAIPTGNATSPNTLLIYNISSDRWYTWQLADNSLSGIYYFNLFGIPRFMFAASSGFIYMVDPTQVEDEVNQSGGPIGITSTIQTSWLNLGDPTLRKILNEIEVATTIPGLTVTIESATDASQFSAPNQLVVNAPLTVNFLGDYKVYTAGAATPPDRFYRFTFSTTSTNQSSTSDNVLTYFSTEAIPFHRI